jgi:hypothetical protein
MEPMFQHKSTSANIVINASANKLIQEDAHDRPSGGHLWWRERQQRTRGAYGDDAATASPSLTRRIMFRRTSFSDSRPRGTELVRQHGRRFARGHEWDGSCWTFSYSNTTAHAAGVYTGTVLYTLTSP